MIPRGSILVIGKHANGAIYTVQIETVVAPVPGEGWLCTTAEGNYVVARTPSTLECYCKFIITCTQLKAVLRFIKEKLPGEPIRLPQAFIKHDCGEEDDGI